MQRGERALILRQLTRRVGNVPESLQTQIEALYLGSVLKPQARMEMEVSQEQTIDFGSR